MLFDTCLEMIYICEYLEIAQAVCIKGCARGRSVHLDRKSYRYSDTFRCRGDM